MKPSALVTALGFVGALTSAPAFAQQSGSGTPALHLHVNDGIQ
jgi:hypothetical protein